MEKISLFLALTSTLVMFNSCSEPRNLKEVVAKKTVTEPTGYDVSNSMNEFSLKFLKNISNSEQKNLIVAPQLTFINLSKFYAGSDGETKKEIQKVCGFPDDTEKLLKSINYFNYQVQQSLVKNKKMYKTADSLWIKKNVEFQKDYAQLVKDYLPLEFFSEDFTKKSLLCQKINGWTENQTNGRIKKLLKENDINRDTMLISINTAYLKGMWKKPFEKRLTSNDKFFVTSKQTKQVEMMRQSAVFRYSEKDYCKYVSLPFKVDGFSMEFILPKKGYSLQNVLEKLSLKELNSIQKDVMGRTVDLKLPKFEFESFINNKKIMKNFGMQTAFNDKADFTKMFSKDAFISKMFQKAFIKVDEEGAEAAAVDVECVAVKCLPPKKAIFYANRPFLFFITHNKTKAILFAGYVVNP